eukprot:CAMPEP_0170562222 /NCGR_PEP_ID=MMETSP0211-20121228/59453_1 /TAXON_ID=311385 /ORGANISM="Pseudokeronopsis sp., Strain OXSARD2" /LENGTH=128 /DNA_ID=CAMNT_0010878833 /DNA_START=1772 /DNA_END=2158 /DNA_ORIENTATION=-
MTFHGLLLTPLLLEGDREIFLLLLLAFPLLIIDPLKGLLSTQSLSPVLLVLVDHCGRTLLEGELGIVGAQLGYLLHVRDWESLALAWRDGALGRVKSVLPTPKAVPSSHGGYLLEGRVLGAGVVPGRR